MANTATVPTTQEDETEGETVNDVVASNIAATVATTTNLSVAPSVTSLAISTQIESELPVSDNSSISKPQIIQVSSAGRNISTYTVKAGDTAQSVARDFGLSVNTIKWANDLTSDNLTVGKKLQILPRDGITYTTKSGDSVKKLAEKYKADASAITTYNDLEISGISSGLKIIIPEGQLPANERPGYTSPITVTSGSTFAGFRAGTVGNKYGYGYCTWYAYERRAAMGLPIGSFWGDAGSWAYSGAASGYKVNNTPSRGALLVELGSPGHVAVVERVASNGDIVVSEMNNRAYGGWNIINNRTISSGQAGSYRYIH